MTNQPIAEQFKVVAIPAKDEAKREEAVEGVLVERVVLVDQIRRRRLGTYPVWSSAPGHLIQLTISGATEHEAEGRFFEMTPGMAVWFHEDEELHLKVTKTPWVFYTVNFIAPRLPPPPFDRRVRRTEPVARQSFEKLLEAWRDRAVQPLIRHMQIEARLLDLLVNVLPAESAPLYIDPMSQVWWELEDQLRGRLQEPCELADLCRLSGRSARTLARACHHATGLAPMKRIKKIRLSMARGLILYSQLNISEVAYRVGYERVQELCRDYRSHVGCTPMEDRAAGPDYRRFQPRYET